MKRILYLLPLTPIMTMAQKTQDQINDSLRNERNQVFNSSHSGALDTLSLVTITLVVIVMLAILGILLLSLLHKRKKNKEYRMLYFEEAAQALFDRLEVYQKDKLVTIASGVANEYDNMMALLNDLDDNTPGKPQAILEMKNFHLGRMSDGRIDIGNYDSYNARLHAYNQTKSKFSAIVYNGDDYAAAKRYTINKKERHEHMVQRAATLKALHPDNQHLGKLERVVDDYGIEFAGLANMVAIGHFEGSKRQHDKLIGLDQVFEKYDNKYVSTIPRNILAHDYSRTVIDSSLTTNDVYPSNDFPNTTPSVDTDPTPSIDSDPTPSIDYTTSSSSPDSCSCCGGSMYDGGSGGGGGASSDF